MARPKVILQLYPVFPSDGFDDRKRKRPLGADRDLYHRIVHEWTDIVVAAEKMGVWGASTIEHHFHSEGYEVGPNPGILNAYWAAKTSTINIGSIGYVMATQDPIRVAEETAILDHLTKGRFWVGVARGYQSRWANVLGQWAGSVATVSDGSAADQKNRDVFEERVDQLIAAWTEESVAFDGPTYKAPFPRSGIEGYPAADTARAAGAPGEVDDNGRVARICVVPKPHQRPHPPLFVATTRSIESVEYCARRGYSPTYFSPTKSVEESIRHYRDVAREHGFSFGLGERQNLVRFPHIAGTNADFRDRLRNYDVDIYRNFYGPFFPQLPQGDDDTLVDGMLKSELFVGGSLQEAKDVWRDIYDRAPCEYITLIWHWAQVPTEVLLDELDLFMREVLPLIELPEYRAAAE
jgi:alkanesulfonate monooxygenase SsuD/methylene tetrahydromethanopterin reductase-like flavin-dependent oxidoreductase (luciferase family)